MSLHPDLAATLAAERADALATPPRLTQDALELELANGVLLTVRYAAADAYSLRWRCGSGDAAAELGIDTAPLHPDLATSPNHLHLADGRVVADPLTRPERAPEDNLRRLVDVLVQDPELTRLRA